MAHTESSATVKVRCPYCHRKMKVPVDVVVDIVDDELYASATPDTGPIWAHYFRKHVEPEHIS